jgi:hypothetical protein
MSFEPIKSSNLEAATYDPQTKTATVKFKNGGTYQYSNVPPDLYANWQKTFQADASSGKFFQQHIKGFPCQKVSK